MLGTSNVHFGVVDENVRLFCEQPSGPVSVLLESLSMVQVSLGYSYLKNNMAMRFPEVRARAAAAQAEAQERQVCLLSQQPGVCLSVALADLSC